MIIKLLGQPIIEMHDAVIAGTVDGVIIKGNKVNCIYHENMEKHFSIPVEKATIGSDAVMIRDMTAMTWASKNMKLLKSLLDVYSVNGKYLGYLHGIEVDEDFVLRNILTEEYTIEMSKIVSYENVIVVDIEEAELKKANATICDTPKDVAPKDEAAVSMEIGPDVKWNDENCLPKEESKAVSELNVVKPVHQDEEIVTIPGVDPKYTYLCGKQLLEDIEISEAFYDKGTIIDADMIRHAIENNAIVKVIVNAED